jgi:peptidoglycan/xylan/chitin deacetylase (PgdA/CDA1 family)
VSALAGSPRAALAWPNGARLAIAVVVNVEHVDWMPPRGAVRPAGFPGPYGSAPYPDVRAWSHREYGNRVGLFRVLDIVERAGMRATVAVDAMSAGRRPDLVADIRRRSCEVIAHGLAVTQPISEAMGGGEEKAYVAASLDALEAAFGRRPRGWHGPQYGQSTRTPAILSALGLGYMLDWPDDERPRLVETAAGPIVSLPMMADLDDVFAQWQRRISLAAWMEALLDAADRMLAESGDAGRALVVNLHPWLIGQPWRSTYLREALAELGRRDGVWSTTCGEIVDCARPQLGPPEPSLISTDDWEEPRGLGPTLGGNEP